MNQKSDFWPVALALVAVVIAIGAAVLTYQMTSQVTQVLQVLQGDEAPGLGATTPGSRFVHGITVGNPAELGVNPTNLKKVLANTCSLIAPSFTVAASTTVAMDCAITGVVSTDAVFGQFATSTNGVLGWSIAGVSASSTAGFATFNVTNGTGASAIIPASLASSTKYIVIGTQ